MNCVSCREAMLTIEINQVEIDFCTYCESIWLDKGELTLLMGEQKAQHYLEELAADHDCQEDDRQCPICDTQMKKVHYGKEQTMVDECPNHCGLWFDKGELQAVLESEFQDQSISLLQKVFDHSVED